MSLASVLAFLNLSGVAIFGHPHWFFDHGHGSGAGGILIILLVIVVIFFGVRLLTSEGKNS